MLGETHCAPCARYCAPSIPKDRGEPLTLTAAQAYGEAYGRPVEPIENPELATMRNASRLLDDLVDMPLGTEAAARVADWLAAKYGSRRRHESNS